MAVVIAVLVGWRIFGRGSDAAYEQLVSENSAAQVQLGGSQALAAEKDSLTNELLETTSLITDISQAVTAVQTGGAAPILSESGAPARPMTAAEARAFLLPKIDSLRLRLRAAESKLAASEARVRQIPATAKLQAQIARYETTVATMRKLVASQQDQLGALTTEVSALRSETPSCWRGKGNWWPPSTCCKTPSAVSRKTRTPSTGSQARRRTCWSCEW
jgi:hypothetical protein